MKNIKEILELQHSFDDLMHDVENIFLALKFPGHMCFKSENEWVDSIFHEIKALQNKVKEQQSTTQTYQE